MKILSPTFDNIVELLYWRAMNQPDQRAYTFLIDGEDKEVSITYDELHLEALKICRELEDKKLGGQTVLLCYPSGLDFLYAFFGCLYAQAIPVPVYLPFSNRQDVRLQKIGKDAQISAVLTHSDLFTRAKECLKELNEAYAVQWFATDALLPLSKKEFTPPLIEKNDLAFLQYTSGSTGCPKGVMVTHGNILHNSLMYREAWDGHDNPLIVSWLPFFHDMGLVGQVIQAIYSGICCIFMSPASFAAKPIRWLKAISKYKATISAGPNFAYELCAKKISPEEKEGLDLRSWLWACNGSEIISSQTIERFLGAFYSCGLRSETFSPGYGLAESTLFVTASGMQEKPLVKTAWCDVFGKYHLSPKPAHSPQTRLLVSCGRISSQQEILIVDPITYEPILEGGEGEIWISGPSVAAGYWKKPQETQTVFEAHLKGSSTRKYLRTGDLGIIKDEQLYLCGRIKDQIILRGVNYYPDDIESVVRNSHSSLNQNRCVAFAIEVLEEEKLVVVVEVNRIDARKDNRELLAVIRQAVLLSNEVQIYAVVLVLPDAIPRTTSGKVQRSECRRMYLDKRLKVVQESILSENQALPFAENSIDDIQTIDLEKKFYKKISQMLKIAPSAINGTGSLIQLGFDSLLALELAAWMEATFNVKIPLERLFYANHLSDILKEIKAGSSAAPHLLIPAQIKPDPISKFEPFPLNDVQQAYFIGRGQHFELGDVSTHIYLELECNTLDMQRFCFALNCLIKRHDMLRAVILDDSQQKVMKEVPFYEIKVLDVSQLTEERKRIKIAEIRDQMSHQILNQNKWPLFEIKATQTHTMDYRLHCSFDALVMDAFSLLSLFQELVRFYECPQLSLTPLQLSFRDCVLANANQESNKTYQTAREYWMARSHHFPSGPELPLAKQPAEIEKTKFVRLSGSLQGDLWKKIKEKGGSHGLTPSAILLGAFNRVLATWSANPHFAINLTIFNRPPIHPEISEIIGDFTSLILLEADNSIRQSFLESTTALHWQLLKDLSHSQFNGVRFQRELANTGRGLKNICFPVVFTSLLGLEAQGKKTDGVKYFGNIAFGITQTPQVWLDHQTYEEEGGLIFNWDYVQELFPPGLIEEMFNAYSGLLNRLACQEKLWESQVLDLVPVKQLERRKIVNDTTAPVPSAMLQDAFIHQASLHPEKEAIVMTSGAVTYHQLLSQSRKLAKHLVKAGAQPNHLIAILMEKGWEQIAAVLAILQSGAAYLPIDPKLPSERIHQLIKLSGAKILITGECIKNTINWPEDLFILTFSDQLPKIQEEQEALEVIKDPDHLAYVIFTSGTQGEPKGVMISHQAALNTIVDINRRFHVNESDKILSLSSLTFDLSVYDLFGLLSAGGTIILPDPGMEQRPDHWKELIKIHKATIWNSVPAFMQMLVDDTDDLKKNESRSLRLVLLSGDWISPHLPSQIKEINPNAEIISLGGATEASIWSIYFPLVEMNPHWKSIPYGRPLANQSFHVFNKFYEHRPDWVKGDLYIGGSGLAKGYWRDQMKTDESFISHPLTGEILYRTGDTGRYFPDGNIEFLGREDLQVKISGYRIELSEIESVLNTIDGIKEAAVITAGAFNEERHLITFIVPEDGRAKADFKSRQLGLRELPSNASNINLIKPEFSQRVVAEFLERQSYRKFEKEQLSFASFSNFLSCLMQYYFEDIPFPKYRYPSAGGLYPVQVYLYLKPEAVDGVSEGVYYYHPKTHQLSFIANPHLSSLLYDSVNQAIFLDSAFAIFLIGKMDAILSEYHHLAKDFCLIEAGAMSQLLMDKAPGNGIGLCPIGNLNFEALRSCLILENNEIFLHGFVGGKINSIQKESWGIADLSFSWEDFTSSIIAQLRKKLPSYSVPSIYVPIDRLPLTANGKLDRKALEKLPLPQTKDPLLPQSPLEEQLWQIWCELLRRTDISVSENFFTAGGNSILAMRMVARIRKELQCSILVRDVFECMSIRGIARLISAKGQDKCLPIHSVGELPHYPLSSYQRGLFFLHSLSKEDVKYNFPFAMILDGNIDLEKLERAFQKLVKRHVSLRTSFFLIEGMPRQRVHAYASIRLIYHSHVFGDSLQTPSNKEIDQICESFSRPFDFEEPPLFRVQLVAISSEKTLLLIDGHHIISDRFSMGILFRELSALYEEQVLPEVTIDYKDFCVWQESYLKSEEVQKQKAYWLNLLSTRAVQKCFPTDYPRKPISSANGDREYSTFDFQFTERLKEIARREQTTLFAVLMSIFQVFLLKYSSQDALIVGTPVIGRTKDELADIVGTFVNTLPIKGEIKERETFLAFLNDIHQKCIQAYDNQDYPFDSLVDDLGLTRELNRHPLFDVVFVFQNMDPVILTLSSIQVTPYRFPYKTSRFDLSLAAEEKEGIISFSWEYKTELYDQSTIMNMALAFEKIAREIASNPEIQIDQIHLSDCLRASEQITKINVCNSPFSSKESDQPQAVIEERKEVLKQVWIDVLEVPAEKICDNANFFSLGGDSIKSLLMVARLRKRNYKINVRDVFAFPTIGALIHQLVEIQSKTNSQETALEGSIPLTPIQKMFFSEMKEGIHHYNQSVMLRLPDHMDLSILESILNGLIVHHDSLRLNYQLDQHTITQIVRSNEAKSFVKLEYADLRQELDIQRKLKQEVESLQGSLKMAEEPLIKSKVFHTLNEKYWFITIHHLLVDWFSWRILLEDIKFGYKKLLEHGGLTFLSKTDGFSSWANHLKKLADHGYFEKELPYWHNLENSMRPLFPLHGGRKGEKRSLSKNLSRQDSKKLRAFSTDSNAVEIVDVLLYALGMALNTMIAGDSFVIGFEGHGRENIDNIDVSRTVGWFTSIFPFRIQMNRGASIVEQLQQIKADRLSVPSAGIGYGVLKYLSSRGNLFQPQTRKPDLLFNYLGDLTLDLTSADFELEPLFSGMSTSPKLCGGYPIELNIHFFDGAYTLNLIDKEGVLEENILQDFLCQYVEQLLKIVNEWAGFDQDQIGVIENQYSLSPMQEGILFHYLLSPQTLSYFQQLIFNLEGQVNIPFLEKAFQLLVDRHEGLRTIFMYDNAEQPKQIVLKEVRPHFSYENLANLHANEVKEKLDGWISAEQAIGFDLKKSPLIRMKLFQIDPTNFVLICSFHHILFDGWSLPIVFSDFLQIYQDLLSQTLSRLPRVPSFVEYEKWLNAQDKEAAKIYWKHYLQNFDRLTSIPRKKAFSGEDNGSRKELILKINQEQTFALSSIAQQYSVTMNSILQCIWGILLKRYNDADDVLFGAVVSGRPDSIEGIDQMVGLFINTLPVRLQFAENALFIDCVRKLQNEAQESNRHGFLSLAEIQNTCDLKHQLMDHILVFENYPMREMVEKQAYPKNLGFTISRVDLLERAEYPLVVIMLPGKEIYVKIQYQSELFDEELLQRMEYHLKNIAKDICEKPEIKVEEIQILSPLEKQQLLFTFNQTDRAFPDQFTLSQLFEEQVKKKPENIALHLGERKLTYREFNDRANRLAWHLRSLGVQRGEIVAIRTERSLEMMIGIYGILKTGAAYLPIDPYCPVVRAQFMLNDAKVKVLLTQECLKGGIEFVGQEITLSVDEKVNAGIENLNSARSPQDLAYVIYTSGSTGDPKGVMIEHASVINRLHWMQGRYPLDDEDVILQKTAFTFDVSVWEIFWWGIAGASVCLLEIGSEKDPALIYRSMIENHITVLHFVPSALTPFLDYIDLYHQKLDLVSLRYAFASGEALLANQVQKFYKLFGTKARLTNLYGPTEAAIDVAYYDCPEQLESETIPIGKPIDNIHLYVLGKSHQLQPLGIAGELCISGVGVGRGYLNNLELTAKKFVRDPFFPERMMYHTGDFAKWHSDGNLEFLGRTDRQVKIHGFRLELDEIEKWLKKHPRVKEGAILNRHIQKEEAVLCAYYHSNGEIDASELKNDMKAVFPSYMIPTYFLYVSDWPLKLNGKLDIQALQKLPLEQMKSRELISAYSELEKRLVQLWQEILQLSSHTISLSSNFFDLGGHSLKAMVLSAKIFQTFHIHVSIRELFDNPTLESQAALIEKARDGFGITLKQVFSVKPIRETSGYYPASPSQMRLFALHQINGGEVFYNMPGAWNIKGKLDPFQFSEAFHKLIQLHSSLRTSFEFLNGELVQKIVSSAPFQVSFCKGDRLKIDSVIKEFIRPFDLSEAPLLRVKLVQLAAEEHLFLFDMHHIIADGVSVTILMEDFMRIYRGEELKAPSIDYKDYTVALKEWLPTQTAKDQEAYWLNRLKDDLPQLSLPTDFTRPPIQSHAGDSIVHIFDKKLVDGLKKLCQAENVTLNMMLLAIFNVLLYRYSGDETILVGTPIAGRSQHDLNQVVGLFVNTLVIQSHVNAQKSFQKFLLEVKERCLEAFENQNYPFEMLAEKVAGERDPSRNPIFNHMFVMQNTEDAVLKMGGVSLEPYPIAHGIAKFDLTVLASEIGQEIQLCFEYCTRLFNKQTIEGMSGHFEEIAKSVLHSPQMPLGSINMLAESEKQLLLSEFNQTNGEFLESVLLHELFEMQVCKNPHAQAVVFESECLSYQELNEQANQIAWTLRKKGIQPNDIVGICLERSTKMIACLVGVLKSGAAYLPIEPDNPPARLLSLLQDSKAKALLVESLPSLLETYQGVIINVKNKFTENSGNLPFVNHPEDLAYIIYTSGTTGLPKGVKIKHRSVMNLVEGLKQAVYSKLNGVLSVALVASYTFDASVQQIFAALLMGHRLVIVPKRAKLQGDGLFRYYETNQIDVSDMTPLNLEMLLSSTGQDYQLRLKAVLIGGDKLRTEIVLELLNKFKNCCPRIYNVYGVTEACVDSTIFEIHPQHCLSKYASIGKPLLNTQIYILNSQLQIQPIGIPGEIFIAGEGVSEGYLNCLDLSQQKFIDCPFRNCKMYRTGDVGRYLNDGSIDFIGRQDSQIKILGMRVELGEIESQILQCPSVESVVVIPLEDENHDKSLCAFVLSKDPSVEDRVKMHLAERLPIPMIPSEFCILPDFPRTSSEKIDIKALRLLLNKKRPQNDSETVDRFGNNFSFNQLFEEQVEKMPDHLAACFEERRLSYRSLNHLANQLARKLIQEGVEQGSIVAIMMERSLDLVIGLLAILKTGAAYLPLDIEYPNARLQSIIEESRVKCILVQDVFQGKAKLIGPLCKVIGNTAIHDDHSNLDLHVLPENLAYVIYTSGSTGKPKGVMISHKSLTNYLRWAQETYLDVHSAFAFCTSISFDLTVTSIFLPLISGGRVLIYPEAPAFLTLEKVMQDPEVNYLKVTPSHLRMIEKMDCRYSQLHCLIVGGERFPTDLAVRMNIKFSSKVKIFNEYGPTETTVGCMVHLFDAENDQSESLSLGKACLHSYVYLLDEHLRQVPPLSVGEIYVGGECLSQGYLNQPLLNEKYFIQDPFHQGRRLYKTGDLAVRDNKGSIEYLRRVDHQVKVNGVRIELEEVEGVINTQEEVLQSVVLPGESDDAGSLIAFVECKDDEQEIEKKLFKRFQEHLPQHMHPSCVIVLKDFPLTFNGKIDREQLLNNYLSRSANSIKDISNDLKIKLLLKIWAEVLHRDLNEMTVDDVFFKIGGDSIKAVQIAAKLQQFGLRAKVRDIFHFPTISQVADHIHPIGLEKQPEEILGEVEITPIQRRFFASYQNHPNHYNQSLMLFRRERFDKNSLLAVLKKLVEHHGALRTRFIISSEGVLQTLQVGDETAFYFDTRDCSSCTIPKNRHAFDERVLKALQAMINDVQLKLNISHGPLVGARLLHAEGGDYLFLTIHHLVIDGVSWRILLEDFETAYVQACTGSMIRLPSKTASYLQWAMELKKYAKNTDVESRFFPWRNLEIDAIHFLPKARSSISNCFADSEIAASTLSMDKTEQLVTRTHDFDHSHVQAYLLTALALTLQEWTGHDRFIIDLEAHGRDALEDQINITRTIGWFTSIFPVLLHLEGRDEMENLMFIQEGLRSSLKNGFIYDLKRFLPSDSNQNLPSDVQPEVCFNYLGQFDRVASDKGFEALPLPFSTTVNLEIDRKYRLQVNSLIIHGQLFVNVEYNRKEYDHKTMEMFCNNFVDYLSQLIDISIEQEKSEKKIKGFGIDKLSLSDLESIRSQL